MAATGLPYVISYVLDGGGAVLDGTPIARAVERIDGAVDPAPLYHSISCVHPSVAQLAIAVLRRDAPEAVSRVRELKANGSPLPTTELVKLDRPESDPPGAFGGEMWSLYDPDGLCVLGGCCGTTDAHMRALAERMAVAPLSPAAG
jgi:S-methylmethionine-dependent homocysteine/selenocysteine methylase